MGKTVILARTLQRRISSQTIKTSVGDGLMSGLNWQRRWDPFRDLQREVGRLFQSLEPIHEWRLERQFPALNLHDAGDHYVLSAQLPGVLPEDVDLSITGETLTMRGERKRPEGVAGESAPPRGAALLGLCPGTTPPPPGGKSPLVSATFANGILTVAIP